ncbi:MAG: sugar nucleotide-binding protein [Lachnospiraceae bacterium]|nr:sugar nucleotide-binding protein [Lachnospiraceae bacterium]
MMEKILVLGASGTVGAAVFRQLSQNDMFDVYGTYFRKESDNPRMRFFSLENHEQINDLLEEIAPNIVISALRGDFQRQMEAHALAAEYLRNNQGRMLYFSTVNVFDGNLVSSHYENDCPESVSEYGKFKILCENRLREILGNQAVILRIPFVYGKNSARMRQVKNGCEAGTLDVYKNFMCNYVTDVQIADYVEWILRENKKGIFHIGTTDAMEYEAFTLRLIKSFGWEYPRLHYMDGAGVMAVLSRREDIPHRLKWNVENVIAYLCG